MQFVQLKNTYILEDCRNCVSTNGISKYFVCWWLLSYYSQKSWPPKSVLGVQIVPTVHNTDLKPLVNSYIQQQLIQSGMKLYMAENSYLVKPTLGPPTKFKHLTRAEGVVITRLRVGHTKATKSHMLSRGLPNVCHHCGQTLTIHICSWSVQCYMNVPNTTQLTHWILSSRQFPRLALWNSYEKWDSSIWYEWSDMQYHYSLEPPPTI